MNDFKQSDLPDGNRKSYLLKKRKKRKLTYIALLVFLLVSILLIIGGLHYYNSVKSSLNQSYSTTGLKSEKTAKQLITNQKPISFLTLGTDVGTDGGFGSDRNRADLTDSMMVVTINPKKNTTTLISIPRDIMTSISGFEGSFPQKLNAAYAFKETSDKSATLGDGVATTMSTIEKMFNIPINYFAMVNMSGLGDIVDQIGGVSVQSPLTFAFSQETAHATGNELYQFTENSTSFEYAKNGEDFTKFKKMNGDAALAFARMRYQDPQGDYGRTQRQRLLLQGIVTKMKQKPSQVVNLKFIQSVTKNIASNLRADDMMDLGSHYLSATKNVKSYSVQGEGQSYNEVSYQRVTTMQRQAITDMIRKSLDLKASETGSEFGSDTTENAIAQVGLADNMYPEFNTEKDLNLQKSGGY